MEDRSDGDLLCAWQAGETEAFEALVQRNQAALLRHAQALLGDWRGGEDVVQDAFLRLAQKPPNLPDDVRGDPAAERSFLSSWLHRVTRNLALDTMRSEKRRKRREKAVASNETTSGGLADIEAEDTRQAVERGLERLPSEQREVLVLRLLGERSYKEIAQITGKKIGTVGWLISAGLKALSSDLSPLLASAPLAPAMSTNPSTDTQAGGLQERLS